MNSLNAGSRLKVEMEAVQEGAQNRHLPSLYRCTASEENNAMYLGHTSLSKGALKNPI